MSDPSGADYFLAVYFTAVAVFYALRLFAARSGKRRLFVGAAGSRHWLGHMAFRVFRLLIWGVCVFRLPFPELDNYLLVLDAPTWLEQVGIFMMCGGLALAIAGHKQLGARWTSGIDPLGPDRLVTDRLYSLSRNPMYTGVLVAQLGFFVTLPSAFTLVCFVAGATAILSQVRLEENHLTRRFPGEYPAYCQRSARWWPGRR